MTMDENNKMNQVDDGSSNQKEFGFQTAFFMVMKVVATAPLVLMFFCAA